MSNPATRITKVQSGLHRQLRALCVILRPHLVEFGLEEGDAGLGVRQVGLQDPVLAHGSFKPVQLLLLPRSCGS